MLMLLPEVLEHARIEKKTKPIRAFYDAVSLKDSNAEYATEELVWIALRCRELIKGTDASIRELGEKKVEGGCDLYAKVASNLDAAVATRGQGVELETIDEKDVQRAKRIVVVTALQNQGTVGMPVPQASISFYLSKLGHARGTSTPVGNGIKQDKPIVKPKQMQDLDVL
jgi:hypothetical protein